MADLLSKLPQKAFFTSSGAVSLADISSAEQALGLTFASDYRTCVAAYGAVSFNGHEFTGVCPFPRLDVVAVTQYERHHNPQVPDDLYVIEQANIDGIVIWQSSGGAIYQTSPGHDPLKLCDSLSSYVDQ